MALRTEVWDLCRPEGVCAARAFQERKLQDLGPGSLALALQEAVNSSSQARRTPLHAAAEAGNAGMVKVPPDLPYCILGVLLPIVHAVDTYRNLVFLSALAAICASASKVMQICGACSQGCVIE